MALYDILRSADYPTESVANRIADELETLFELHQFEYFRDVEECIDDSDDWLVGTLESREYGVTINLYLQGDGPTMKAHVDTELDQWWSVGLTSFEDIAYVVTDAVTQIEREQRTLTNE